jgi:hypothetical protein
MKSVPVCVACVGTLLIACGQPPSAPSGDAASLTTLVTPHFTFSYASSDAALVQNYGTTLEEQFARITTDLGVASMPRVAVHFYPTHNELAAAVAPLVGSIPSWANGLATASDQIHVVVQIGATNLVHEFAHCVSMRINPRIANNPRWFWESVAIFEAGQRVNPAALSYMVAGTPPAIAALNGFDNTLIYDVGYTIGEFIDARGGRAAIRALIANQADVQATLGLSLPEFERAWFVYTRETYKF